MMKILSSEQIRKIDKYTIENEPVPSIDLMERAATVCAGWLNKRYPSSTNFVIFAGPGNNGGDGLAVARLLADRGYNHIKLVLLKFTDKFSRDFSNNLERLKRVGVVEVLEIKQKEDFPGIPRGTIMIDAIFGSGLSRPAKGLPAEIIDKMNASGAKIISIDIPSGLFGEDNSKNPTDHIIHADYTLTFQIPKLAFLFPENETFVGNWLVLSIGLHPKAIEEAAATFYLLEEKDIHSLLKKRKKFSHKGHFGHALLIAGSYGKMGAAVLSANGCLKSGVGLLTAHVPRLGYNTIQIAVPEAMAIVDDSDEVFSVIPDLEKFDVLGIGPGIGKEPPTVKALQDLLNQANKPMVLDADALNIVSESKDLLKKIPAGSILTPHPGEFSRLGGKTTNSFDRINKASELAREYHVVVILKGAYTSIHVPDGSVFFNTSGNPGMATGGTGDVLTGITLGMISQGYASADAAKLAVYIHGLAGDLAVEEMGQEALVARNIIDYLGKAFLSLQ